MLLKAAERLADARSRGYAVQLQWIYPGRRDTEIDRLARSFNRRNLREDVSVNIVSLDDLLELRQQSSAERSAVEENGLLEFERDEPTAAVRGLRDDPDSRATMPIPNETLDFDDETITGSYDLEQEDAERPEAFLIVLAGNREGEMVRLGSRMIIGRGSRASFRIDDSGISREHLSVAHAGEGRTSIVDLDSRNGVYLNGRRIKRAVLKDGDKIRIGANTVLKYALADALDESFQQRMYDAALRDPLTGLYNRRHLMDQLETEFSFALRHHGSLSLVLVDVDHFKELNDTRGHLLGDAVLRGIASRLRSALRKEDLAARYGGDEFAILCRDTPAEIAETAARRVLRIVRRPELVDNTPDLEIGACLGVASIPHPQLLDHLALFKAADEALYRAKNAGRNRLCVFGRGESGEFS
jgi:diguanylate cyclase (GGDEF)-like protein